jgi:hypothetical protein
VSLRARSKKLERTDVRKENRMNKMLMSALGVAGILAALAGPAVAQEGCGERNCKADGKRLTRTEGVVNPCVESTTMTVAVAPGDRREGDSWRMKYDGKRTTREYTREVLLPEVVKGHECTWRFRTVGRTATRENYCVVNGVEQSCYGMNNAGECIARH